MTNKLIIALLSSTGYRDLFIVVFFSQQGIFGLKGDNFRALKCWK